MAESLKLTQEAISKLESGDPEEAIAFLSEVRKTLTARITKSILGANEYSVLKETAYMMQCASLYYLTMSNRENIQNDPISRLAYLGYALGIHAVLNTVLLPLIRDYATTFNNESESLLFSKLNSKVEDDMYKSMIHTINYVKGKEKEEAYARLEKTAKEIIKAVDRSSKEIRELAVELSRKFPAGDFKQARRLYEYVRDEIQYIHDPLGIEEIQSPQLTLRLSSGDCDDKAILLTSLLMAIGFESSFIFADTDGDGLPDHVYSAVHLPNAPEYCKPFPHKEMPDGKDFHDWVPLDPTFQDSDFGVIPISDLEGIKLVPVMFR